MKILYPLAGLMPGTSGGIETYARSLIRALQEVDRTNEYTLVCNIFNRDAFPVAAPNFNKVVRGSNLLVEIVKRSLYTNIQRVVGLIGPRPVFMALKNAASPVFEKLYALAVSPPDAGKTPANDIIHYLFNYYPYERDPGVPVVLTIVDIQHEFLPDFFSAWELEQRRQRYRLSAERAEHIIAISGYTKNTIVEKYRIPEEKVTVVHLGYSSDDFRRLDPARVEAFRIKHGLPEGFLFYPAATWQHKNHVGLVRALKILKDKHGFKKKLVLTGHKSSGAGQVDDEIRRLGLSSDVTRLGYLPYHELPLVYGAAGALVFPSFFEGFGIPVVEAMATGLPVACSNTTSLPEVGGDAAVYFDPSDPDDIAEKVWTLYNDESLRKTLVKKGLERAKLFTWTRTAEETVEVYKKVYARTGATLAG